MKKSISVYVIVFFVSFFTTMSITSNACAYRSYDEKFSFTDDLSIGLRAGAIINRFDKNYTFGMPARGFSDVSITGKDGWYIEFLLDKELNDFFVVGVETGHMQYDMDFAVNPVGTTGVQGKMGSMEILPLLARLRIQYPMEDYSEFSDVKFRFSPYASIGVGGLFTNFEEDGYVNSTGNSFSTDSSALAGKYGLGFDFYINEQFALNLEGSFVDTDVKMNVFNQGIANTEDVHQNSWLIGGGAKYSF